MIIIITTILLSFLMGSIPTGYLLIKRNLGIDIRTQGSGNIGSTNVKRVAGKKISVLTQVGDIVKGLLPVLIAAVIAYNFKLPISSDLYLSLVALAAILGHDYTPFLGFNGGKGVNTTLGAYFLLAPLSILLGVAVYFLLRYVTKIVSIRSMALGITIPLVAILTHKSLTVVIFTTIACLLLIFRHRDNIKRIVNKEEN